METIETFMEIFKRSVAERNSSNLKDILKDGLRYFRNISRSDSKLVLCTVFDCDNGLLAFLEDELSKSISQKGFDEAIKEGFYLLKFIIEQFSGAFEIYIPTTKAICVLAVTMQCSSYIKKAACSTFNALIELFNDIDLSETVETFVHGFHKYDITERCFVFSILGKIAKHHPHTPEMDEYSAIIFKQLHNDFKMQYKPNSGSQSPKIQIYLDVFMDMLGKFQPQADVRIKYYQELYSWIKNITHATRNERRKVTLRSAVNLLSQHMNIFQDYLYSDYKYWHNLFITLTKEKDVNSQCGQHALKSFYKVMGNILQDKNTEEGKAIFLYFKDIFVQQLTSQEVESNSLRLIIYGFSQMAGPCKRYLTEEDVKHMYSLITHCTIPLCNREDIGQIHLENICDYQEALSEILTHISDISVDQINVLIKLSTLVVKRFPNLSVTSQTLVISSLIKTIINVEFISKIVLDEFLYNLIHVGIIWSCSHTLFIDAELQRNLNNLEDRPVCYKNYLPLWTQFLKHNRYEIYGKTHIISQIFDTMINIYITLVGRLNLSTRTKEGSIFSDVAFSEIAANEADFRIFINLIDLYVDIIYEIDSSVFVNILYKFLYETIKLSYKHPMISGFYKLVHATCKSSDIFDKISIEENAEEIEELLYKYLSNTLNLITTFSNELLIACLYLILDAPLKLIQSMLNRTIPVFKITFTMGLSDFKLACAAMDTLEKWTRSLENRQTKEFLCEIVPYLEPYLQSRESSVELLQDIIKTERKVVKRITLIEDEETLEKFQSRILLFLSSLDSDITLDLVYKRSLDTGASWDKKDLLKYTLPFPDLKIDIYFDKILPRLITLAQNSGDRRTKVISCEVLHSMITFILGKTIQFLTSDPDRFLTIYKTLYPALLNLGCDSDQTVRDLFQPLTVQLMHWLSSKHMLESPTTIHLIDSLFEGLSSDSNSSLREFSGMCLAEFTEWSMKEASDQAKIQVNIHVIMRKINNFALHPFMWKRIAAATAFNHLYKILREDEEIVSIYWLELLYCFIKSLNGCNDPSINNAVAHVERVLQVKSELLKSSDRHRRKPHEFEGDTLEDAANWLFTQCGCLDESCRKKCMELYIKLIEYADSESPRDAIKSYINARGIESLNNILLQDIKPKIENTFLSDILPLLKGFDCYVWLIENELIDLEYLFADVNPKKDIILDCAKNFIHLRIKVKLEDKKYIATISKEIEELQTLQCKLIVSIFRFVHLLLNMGVIPEFFLNTELFELIARCIINPQTIGFDLQNFELSEMLSSLLENLLNTIKETNNDGLLNILYTQLSMQIEKHANGLLNLDEIVSNKLCTELEQYMQGLILLKRSKLFDSMCKDNNIFGNPEDKLQQVFNVLAKEYIGELTCTNFKPAVLKYIQVLMKFLLTNYELAITTTLINLIANDTILRTSDSTKIKHGEYFLNIFKDVIYTYLLRDVEETMSNFDNLLLGNPSLSLTLIEGLLLFARRYKKEIEEDSMEKLANAVIKRFTALERVACNVENRRQKLINIFGIALHLKREPTEILFLCEDLYLWILKQLTEDLDIEYKTQILQHFLIGLTDMTSTSKPELIAILRKLKSDRLSTCPNDLSECNVNAFKVINCFQTLLTLLPVTKSAIVLEAIILFAAGEAKCLCNEKTSEYLEKYFLHISNEHVLKSLEKMYKLYMDPNGSKEERFDIMERFLLPVFQFCKTTEIEKFYEKNIKEIYTIIAQSLSGSESDIKQLIISKIGCYELIAIMFAKVDVKRIDSTESKITKNAISNVKSGRELIQQLYLNALRVRTLKTTNSEHKEIMRLLHCSAYNCSIAIVSLKEDEASYISIFAEDRKKGQLIWENIIDCTKQYTFRQTFVEYPKNRKKFINIRKSVKEKWNTERSNNSYVYSYNIATSTLTEDINAYDLNEAVLLPKSDDTNQAETMAVIFESDDLNNHECMASICGVLMHMISKGIFIPPGDENNITLPKWLKCFQASMSTEHTNVKLFMLKIILNTQTILKPYAKFFLSPIINVVYSYLKAYDLSYIITDILMMLVDWHMVAIPSETNDKMSAQKLFELLIYKISIKGTSKTVYKYNMDIIKMMIEVWQTCLEIPKNLNKKMTSEPGSATYLILICLVNNMEKEIVHRDDIIEFLNKNLDNWQSEEETLLRTCEAFGLIFKFLNNNEEFTRKKCETIDKIRGILRQMQAKSKQSRCIEAIKGICKNYPDIATDYLEFITLNISRVDSLRKANCLDILLMAIPNLPKEQIVKDLGYMKFCDILKNKVPHCEKVALKIINALVPVVVPCDLLQFIHSVPPYTKSDSVEYREIAYNIFKSIYKKYFKNISHDEDVNKLIGISKQILLFGLLDTAEDLRKDLLKFWTEEAELIDGSKDRLLQILKLYSPNLEDVFLSFIPLAMLNYASKSSEYSEKMFEPLKNCNYKDYKITVLWRTKNLGSMAPLFAPSLASQMNQMFTQSNTLQTTNVFDSHGTTSEIFDNDFELRATQEPEFDETLFSEPVPITMETTQYDDELKIYKVPQPAFHKRSKRFLASSSATLAIRQKEIKKNIQRAEMIKDEVARQRNSIKLYRNYRIGDFPDIEITHSSLIDPLQELLKKDQLICKDLTVSIFCSLIKEVTTKEKSNGFLKTIVDLLNYILQNCQGSNPIITAILETLLASRTIDCSPEIVAKVSKKNGISFLGALLLEENLIYNTNNQQPPAKKLRGAENIIDSDFNKWVHLASLYESLNEIDVVLSIFGSQASDQIMQEASSARIANDWIKAKEAYERAFQSEAEFVKEHCFQGLLECLSHLCKWTEIEKHIENKLDGNLNSIWDNKWKDWMFSWMFKPYICRFLQSNHNESLCDFIQVLQSWITDQTKVQYIKRNFGEELATFFMHDQPQHANSFLTNTLDEIREQWIKLNPLSTQLKINKLQRLRKVNDIKMYLKILDKPKSLYRINDLLKYWVDRTPRMEEDILSWDELTSYRIYYTSLLESNIEKNNRLQNDEENETLNEEENDVIKKLHAVSYQLRLRLIDVALNQKESFIAKKYSSQMKTVHKDCSLNLKQQLQLSLARVKYVNAETEMDTQRKMDCYASAWKNFHKLLEKDITDVEIKIAIKQHISRIASTLAKLSYEDDQFVEALKKSNAILHEINIESNLHLNDISSTLETYGLNQLKSCCDMATDDFKHIYFKLSKYCYDRLSNVHGNSYPIEVSKEFVKSTLRAMSHGSLKAAHYFPCLLKTEYLEDEETKQIFARETKEIQPWLYLSWQAQLFSHLGTSIAPLIIPIIERLVETYPNAVIYTLRLTVELNPTLLNDPQTYRIRRILYDRPDVEQFLAAMQYVVQPELYLKHYLYELVRNLSQGKATAIDEVLKKVYPSSRESKDGPRQGNIYGEIAKYKNLIKQLRNSKDEQIKQHLSRLNDMLTQSLCKRKDRVRLKDYSPWLHEYTGSDLEVPGQYTGNRKPMPDYHAKIMKVEPTVKVMKSLRKPIRLTLVGNDGKDYNFLVKFGEDLRLDQRLQQLFTIMNKALQIDTACKQRRLSIDTYQVIPLSLSLGIIQWVDNTRSLQELITFTCTTEEVEKYDSIRQAYATWIQRAAPKMDLRMQYKEATLKYDRGKVLAQMNEFISKTEWDSLRRTFKILSPSPESFVTLRHNFITTYATMCIAHWVLGIGDRHLENILVTVQSGRSLGIDFGLAFDAGIDQKVPELMPFRLTPQILGLLKPFTETDLLGATMTHVLQALKNERGPIVASMDVFVHEPLNWTENVNKALKENEDDNIDVKWLPKKKISIVIKKLDGVKPSLITLDQLKDQHNDKYFERYALIVNGNDDVKQTRITIGNDHLSSKEQVKCLLDQATDLNVLGRTYVGWKPWL